MRIRRLKVADCAGVAAASVDLEPGLNVLHGPNELGKSTLVEALRAVLLLQSGATAADDALDDWHSDRPPTVALTFEQDERVWRVRKTFRRGGGQALLEFSRDGRDFSTDSRGREVDGKLNEMLAWGAQPPGGRGGPRGMPSTLITTALLGRQDEVAAILEGSLKGDPTDSGREQLMRALEGLAEDPRLKSLLDAVQEKVGFAYTATGQRRRGQGSPWTKLQEQRLAAEKGQQEVRSRQEESEGVRRRVNELRREQTEAEAVREATRRDLDEAREAADRRDELEQSRQAFRSADEEATRIETLIRTRDEKLAAVEAAEGDVDELSAEHAELERAAGRLGEQLTEARERLREVEAGGGEQERRLREQEMENRLLKMDREQEEFDRRIEDAERFAELNRQVGELGDRIAAKERDLAEARRLVAESKQETESDRRLLQKLRLELLGARYLAASEELKACVRQHEEARSHASAAAAARDEAASLREQAADLRAPSGEEIERLKKLEADLRLGRERLAVGLVVDLELQAGATAEVRADGSPETVQVEEGRHADFEARRELRIDIPGVGAMHVRGGGKKLAAAADAAEQEIEAFRRPLLERAGVATGEELEDLHRQAESLLAAAEEQDRSAAEAEARAEGIARVLHRSPVAAAAPVAADLGETHGLEALERGEALARGALNRSREVLAEALADAPDGALRGALAEGVSVEEHVRSLDMRPPRGEAEISADIEKAQRRVEERRERCRGWESKVERIANDLGRDRQEQEARQAELLRADADGEWRSLLAGAAERRAELLRQREAAASGLEAVRSEAADQVDEARERLAKIEQDVASVRSGRNDVRGRLASRREELAGLKSEVGVHEKDLAREDVEAARRTRTRCRETLERLEADLAGVPPSDVEELERADRDAEATVLRITEELQRRRGALEQVGGAYAEEQVVQAQERVDAIREREADLEVEYEAWKLLGETLGEVEKQETAHLGKALVGPVSSRFSTLTGGRYGDVAIGPELDAGGIRFAGEERKFSELSVGAREQIAILLRLSIAEALGAFVVLDDQLTQTDKNRMTWLRELLEEAAARIQIVVLTCHPAGYGSAPGTHVVDLASLVRRSQPGS